MLLLIGSWHEIAANANKLRLPSSSTPTERIEDYCTLTCPLSRVLLRNSAHSWCSGASRQIQVVILWTLCPLFAFLKYAVKIPSSKSLDTFTFPNMTAGSDTLNGFILCSLWECICDPVFLCLMKEHSLRVSTRAEIQEDFPVPGGPATIIPTEKQF